MFYSSPEAFQEVQFEDKLVLSAKLSVLPPYDDDLLELVEMITKKTDNALKVFFSANIFLSFFMASLLQYLWGMINSLQIIVLTDLFGLQNVPPNASMVMQSILKMCSLEFIDTGFVLEALFNFRETSAFSTRVTEDGVESSKFADAGYESAIFFELLGPLLFVMIVFCLMVLLRKFA